MLQQLRLRPRPGPAARSVTLGLPSVTVPVLSSTTVFTVCAVSSASADLIRMPFSAPLPVPTMMAVGVASPSAQGQEITSTAIADGQRKFTGLPQQQPDHRGDHGDGDDHRHEIRR